MADSGGVAVPLERVASILAIQELSARYALAIDSRNPRLVASLFVDDVNMGRQFGRGRAAAEAFFAETYGGFRMTVNQVSNFIIDFDDDDHARGTVYGQQHQQAHDGTWSHLFWAYFDTYERRDGRWYFAARETHFWMRDRLGPLAEQGVRVKAEGDRWTPLPEAWPTWNAFWSEREQKG